MSEQKMLALVVSKLSKAQVSASGDQAERSYGLQMSIAGLKTVDIEEFTRIIPETSAEL